MRLTFFFLVTITTLLLLQPIMLFAYESQVSFIQNKGQIIDINGNPVKGIQYYIRTNSMNIFFHRNSISYVFTSLDSNLTNKSDLFFKNDNSVQDIKQNLFRIDMDIENSNQNVVIVTEGESNYYYNYYLETCPKGLIKVKTFKKIIYKNIYNNIDLIFKIVDNKVKYEFIVHPGAKTTDIELKYNGLDQINKWKNNSLVINSKAGKIYDNSLICYQNNKEISATFFTTSNTVKFIIDSYDRSIPLIIDPEILWSTYIGGSDIDHATRIKTDHDGYIVVTGISQSINFPTTTGAYQSSNRGAFDMFISKLTIEGDLIWSSYFGGSGIEHSTQLTIDNNNNYFFGSESRSYDMPIINNAQQKTYGGGTADAALVKCDENGIILYSTYYGGSAYESFTDAVIDNNNNIWLTGGTWSDDYPTTSDSYQRYKNGHYDATITMFDDNGKCYYASFWGGSTNEYAFGIAMDKNQDAAITGYTSSENFFTNSGAHQKTFGGEYDAFVTKINSNGQPLWSTYLGGTGSDFGNNICCDNENCFITSGFTSSQNFDVTANVCQPNYGGVNDEFVTKFDPDGNRLWSTFYGGNDAEGYITYDIQYGGLAVDKFGNTCISGITTSQNLLTCDSAISKKLKGSSDAYILILNKNGNLLYSTYLGGSNEDRGYDVHFDSENSLYTVGRTNSSDFPIIGNAFQSSNSGAFDGYIVKFGVPPVVEPDTCVNSFTYDGFDNSSDLTLTGYSRYIDSVTRLTPTKFHTFGSMWYKNKLSIADGFITSFSFKILYGDNVSTTDNSLPGADGLAFIISNSDIKDAGCMGGGIFYDGLPNSLAIEFDTFCNDSLQIFDFKDPNGNHLAVQTNGTGLNSSTHTSENCLAMCTTIPSLKPDGTTYYVQIEYSKELSTLKIWLDEHGSFLSPSIVIQDFNLKSLLNLEDGKRAYMGIGAATGDAYAYHDVLDWYLCLMSSDKMFTSVDSDGQPDNINEVFPNPVKDVASLRFSHENTSAVVVNFHDAIGRSLKKISLSDLDSGIHEINCNFANFESGMYYYTISDGSKIQSGKFIIRK